jgi:hypothetical protein
MRKILKIKKYCRAAIIIGEPYVSGVVYVL